MEVNNPVFESESEHEDQLLELHRIINDLETKLMESRNTNSALKHTLDLVIQENNRLVGQSHRQHQNHNRDKLRSAKLAFYHAKKKDPVIMEEIRHDIKHSSIMSSMRYIPHPVLKHYTDQLFDQLSESEKQSYLSAA